MEFTINDYDKNNAKLVYYDTIEEAIQLSTLNAENEELSVPADFLNHVDETLHIWQGKKYDTIFYRAGNDNDDIQGLVMARCKKQIQNGHTQYCLLYTSPDRQKRISERALGTRYGKEHLEQTFLRKDPLAILYVRSHLCLVVNLQTNVKACLSLIHIL